MLHSLNNCKTTIAGVGAILGSISHLLIALSNGDTSTIFQDLTALSAGIGLVMAQDAHKP